ncbi:hypothetical protein B0H14DRAFT_2627644 [Mycena olivaceomarginata]|nr:hypothetical protein B0H14DRAFT_2627644 [Mycena olivaceomarginata]
MCQHNAVTQLPGGDKPCRRSSASHRIPPCRPPTRGRFLAIGIHRATPRIFNELLGKMKALVAAVVALPVVQKNLLKYQTAQISANSSFDEHIRAFGLPASTPQYTAPLVAEYEVRQSLVNTNSHTTYAMADARKTQFGRHPPSVPNIHVERNGGIQVERGGVCCGFVGEGLVIRGHGADEGRRFGEGEHD